MIGDIWQPEAPTNCHGNKILGEGIPRSPLDGRARNFPGETLDEECAEEHKRIGVGALTKRNPGSFAGKPQGLKGSKRVKSSIDVC